VTGIGLYLDSFGTSAKHGLRRLLTEFKARGWRDPGDAALLVIRTIEAQPGITPERAAAAAPLDFFDRNSISRKDLAEALSDVANRS
jgi:hypothetical protein